MSKVKENKTIKFKWSFRFSSENLTPFLAGFLAGFAAGFLAGFSAGFLEVQKRVIAAFVVLPSPSVSRHAGILTLFLI